MLGYRHTALPRGRIEQVANTVPIVALQEVRGVLRYLQREIRESEGLELDQTQPVADNRSVIQNIVAEGG